MALLIPIVPRADSGWYLVVPLLIAGSGLGLLVSQLNNYTLVADLGGAGQRGRRRELGGGSFGLSFGLAFAGAIMLATLSITFTNMAEDSTVLSAGEQQQVATALEDDAEVMSNTQLEELLAGQPAGRPGRDHPHQHGRAAIALQVALLVPLLAGLARAAHLVPDDAPAGPPPSEPPRAWCSARRRATGCARWGVGS